MCRLVAYFGSPITLDTLLYAPEHSLLVQSYQPKEMTAGIMNADGVGMGWYRYGNEPEAFTYRNILPMWSDINLPQLSRYVNTKCSVAYVRSATPGQATDLSNCQPFQHRQLLFVHNGFIENFRQTLYRPLCDRLDDRTYQSINGTTDSEHIFALIVQAWEAKGDLKHAVRSAMATLAELSDKYHAAVSANIAIADGEQIVATRFATPKTAPSLYVFRDAEKGVTIASEPLFAGNWQPCPDGNLILARDRHLDIEPLF